MLLVYRIGKPLCDVGYVIRRERGWLCRHWQQQCASSDIRPKRPVPAHKTGCRSLLWLYLRADADGEPILMMTKPVCKRCRKAASCKGGNTADLRITSVTDTCWGSTERSYSPTRYAYAHMVIWRTKRAGNTVKRTKEGIFLSIFECFSQIRIIIQYMWVI